MPQVTCSVSKILSYMSGNQGLTKKTIHYDRKNLGADAIEVLSSSIIDDTSMGYVSRNLILPNKKHIKIFEDKEGILVSRNGNAGILTYLPKGKYPSKNKLEKCFIELSLPYRIKSSQVRYNGKRKTCWKLYKI